MDSKPFYKWKDLGSFHSCLPIRRTQSYRHRTNQQKSNQNAQWNIRDANIGWTITRRRKSPTLSSLSTALNEFAAQSNRHILQDFLDPISLGEMKTSTHSKVTDGQAPASHLPLRKTIERRHSEKLKIVEKHDTIYIPNQAFQLTSNGNSDYVCG